MNKEFLITLFLAVLFITTNSNVLHAQSKTVSFINNETSLEDQANDFAFRLGKIVELDENQAKTLAYLRLIYLAELRKLEENESLTIDAKREEANMLQQDYDDQFSTILTAEQKFKIRSVDYKKS